MFIVIIHIEPISGLHPQSIHDIFHCVVGVHVDLDAVSKVREAYCALSKVEIVGIGLDVLVFAGVSSVSLRESRVIEHLNVSLLQI